MRPAFPAPHHRWPGGTSLLGLGEHGLHTADPAQTLKASPLGSTHLHRMHRLQEMQATRLGRTGRSGFPRASRHTTDQRRSWPPPGLHCYRCDGNPCSLGQVLHLNFREQPEHRSLKLASLSNSLNNCGWRGPLTSLFAGRRISHVVSLPVPQVNPKLDRLLPCFVGRDPSHLKVATLPFGNGRRNLLPQVAGGRPGKVLGQETASH